MFAMHKISREDVESRVVECATDTGIRKTDEINSLECFCSDNPPKDEFEMKIRGYIFDGNTLVFESGSYPTIFDTEYNDSDYNANQEICTNNFDDIGDITNYKITPMREGTAIRVFNYLDKWYVASHRKIDAFKSKWGKVSFGEIFENNIMEKTGKSLSEFLETLNKNYNYTFLAGTTNITRIVSPERCGLHLLYTKDKLGNEVVDDNLSDWYIESLNLKSINEVMDYLNELKFPFADITGVFLSSKNKNFKIFNKEYRKLYKLRNNLPSIPFAYLHNVFNEKNRSMFRDLYKEFVETFDYYDYEIQNISADILEKYIRKYVKKENIIVTKHEQNILYHVHGIYLKTRQIIRKEQILQVFAIVPPSNINKIIFSKKTIKV